MDGWPCGHRQYSCASNPLFFFLTNYVILAKVKLRQEFASLKTLKGNQNSGQIRINTAFISIFVLVKGHSIWSRKRNLIHKLILN